jgi:hypothetical protein
VQRLFPVEWKAQWRYLASIIEPRLKANWQKHKQSYERTFACLCRADILRALFNIKQGIIMAIPGSDLAIKNIMRWSQKENWASYQEQIFAEHFDEIISRTRGSKEEAVDQLGDAFGMIYGFVFEDFLTAQFGDEDEINIIDDYLKRRGWCEKVPAKRYLMALRHSIPSLYEVVDLDPGHSLTIRDIILVSVRKVLESYESDVIQGPYRRMEGKANVDIRKPRFL